MEAWCTIESDPAVLTEMLEKLGVQKVVVQEVVTMDDFDNSDYTEAPSLDNNINEPLGIILLFKYGKKLPADSTTTPVDDVYFAQQTVTNACATQALLNVILNHAGTVAIGDHLSSFLEMTGELPPDIRGEVIGSDEVIQQVHNSFARPPMFAFEDTNKKGDVYHFTAFMMKGDDVIELDGLKESAIKVGGVESSGSSSSHTQRMDVLKSAVQRRIELLSSLDNEGISFALLSVMRDPLPRLEERLQTNPGDVQLQSTVSMMKSQREVGKLENNRRRHNYVPAIFALLETLAEKGKLNDIIQSVSNSR